MKVRFLKPANGTVEGLSLRKYKVGETYDLPATLAAYLVAEGFAFAEMRNDRHPESTVPGDRRKPKP